MSAVYEYYKDMGNKKSSKAMKRYGKHVFRKAGKRLLDDAPTKYWGCKSWYN